MVAAPLFKTFFNKFINNDMTAKDFYELMRRAGKTEDITSNPDPDYNQPFYQAIFNLMDEYVTAKNHWVEGFGTSRLYFSPTWDRVERAALTEQGRRKDNPLNWGTTDGVHIMYTYRGKFHAALKTWDFERTERVLKRLGASYWEIAVTDDVPCPHRKKDLVNWHDNATLCRACNCIIRQNGRNIVPPTPLTL